MDGKKEIDSSMLLIFIAVILISLFAGAFFYNISLKNSLSKNVNSKYGDVSVSFIINDIDFRKEDQTSLNNAVILAKRYNMTFDLGVIAQPFSENYDPETFKIYQDNQDIFEIVAHGLTHASDLSFIDKPNESGSYGEFHILPTDISVPANIQDEHIKKMRGIFERYNMTSATQMFTVPYYDGDENTISMAEANGYKLIIMQLSPVQIYTERKYGNIIASENYVFVHPFNIFNVADLIIYNKKMGEIENAGQKNVYMSFHPVNFESLDNIDKLIKEVIYKNPDVKFVKVSSRLK